MKTFLTALLLAILCNLQHVALADEEASGDKAHEAEFEEVHETDPEEYKKQMEKISLEAETKTEEAPLGEETSDDEIPAPPENPDDAIEKVEPDAAHVDDAYDEVESEKGMLEAEADNAEVELPTEYPVVDFDDSHVSAVHEEDEDSVFFTITYSYFEGADAYELCTNCDIDKEGKRVGSSGAIEKFTEEGDNLCDVGPACFNTVPVAIGQHAFSMRAHTAKGWTIWGPNTTFDVQSIIGTTHEEL